jgi:colanic acid biosynthesis glycosyl transferase WcaI
VTDPVVSEAAAARPHVVFVNRFYAPDLSATSQMLTGIATALAADGIGVTVVTSRQRYDDAAAVLPTGERLAGVRVVRVYTTRFGRQNLAGRAIDYLSFYASTFVALCRLLDRGSIVVAKTDPPLVALVCAPAAAMRGARLVNWLQDVFPEVAEVLGQGGLPRWLLTALARLRDGNCRRAAANVVLGPRMRAFLLGRDVAPEKVCVIPNWADERRIMPVPSHAAGLRRSLGWDDRCVVAYCGNLGRAHDHETLLAAALALGDDPSVGLLMVGGGAGMAILRAEVEARGLGNVRFLPYQPEEALGDLLASADVHLVCLKPEMEGLVLPSKLYGILAAGRPAIFWGDPGGDVATELIAIGAGLVVRAGDGAALAASIRSLAGDPKARAELGARARSAFEANYTQARAAAAWVELLRGLQSGVAPAGR